jgi:hypothetical protein
MIVVLTIACAGYAYYINSRRAEDDPQKRIYHPLGIIFAPVTLPALLLFSVSIFILRVLTYGVFLILFVIFLIVFRKPFLLTWLQKMATYIGNKLLEANTFLIKLFLKPWIDHPKST